MAPIPTQLPFPPTCTLTFIVAANVSHDARTDACLAASDPENSTPTSTSLKSHKLSSHLASRISSLGGR